MIKKEEINRAAQVLAPYLVVTPLTPYKVMGDACGLEVYTKMELLQKSGSFKARGAYYAILSVPESQRQATFFVAASTGNHGIAFCTAIQELGLHGKVFLPTSVSASKLKLIEQFGIPFELVGTNSLDTEMYCRAQAEEHGYMMVHPYNDPYIVAGQGTVAIELLNQLPSLDAVVVPVGGGGLISGIASYLKGRKQKVCVIGCQPEESPEMVMSIHSGKILGDDISRPTLSDGTAGGLEPNSITFEICQELVDEWCLVSEQEIAFEIAQFQLHGGILIEGAAALSLACIRKLADGWSGKKVVALLTGSRLNKERYLRVMNG